MCLCKTLTKDLTLALIKKTKFDIGLFIFPISFDNKTSLDGSLDNLRSVTSSTSSSFSKPIFTMKGTLFFSVKSKIDLVTDEASSFEKTNPIGPLICSDKIDLLALSTASFAKVFLVILKLADALLRAFLNSLI